MLVAPCAAACLHALTSPLLELPRGGKGESLDAMRERKWFYPPSNSSTFYSQWQIGYGGALAGDVQWSALATGLPSWLIMILIVCLDNMLKLSSTEVQASEPHPEPRNTTEPWMRMYCRLGCSLAAAHLLPPVVSRSLLLPT